MCEECDIGAVTHTQYSLHKKVLRILNQRVVTEIDKAMQTLYDQIELAAHHVEKKVMTSYADMAKKLSTVGGRSADQYIHQTRHD